MENQLTRYGAIAKALNIPVTGKVFFAVSSSDTLFGDFQNAFRSDMDGVVRVYGTIQGALDACVDSRGDVVMVLPRELDATDTDPVDWAETLTMSKCGVTLMGMVDNRTQGGLPQIKKGSGSTALLTISAPGCAVRYLGFNGSGSTGGGILLNDDGGSTAAAFGTVIEYCHFKNCKGSTATSAATGGAIQWSANGGAWQVLIRKNMFYKNVGDIVLKGTSGSVPQDVVIEDNVFSGPAANVDCNLYLAGGSGMNGVYIRGNVFPAFPALSSGATLLYMSLTGCVGILAGNYFGTDKTFGAAGDGALVPTTVFLSGNYDEGGLIARV